MAVRNFTQFYSTKTERDKNLRKEYETQMEYRKHLQAFIDRWRYNANRAAQAQSKIKILEKVCGFSPALLSMLLKACSSFQNLRHRRPMRRKPSNSRRRRRSRHRCYS